MPTLLWAKEHCRLCEHSFHKGPWVIVLTLKLLFPFEMPGKSRQLECRSRIQQDPDWRSRPKVATKITFWILKHFSSTFFSLFCVLLWKKGKLCIFFPLLRYCSFSKILLQKSISRVLLFLSLWIISKALWKYFGC